ncbi:MAG: hypothetical protein IKY91_06595 [Akkermansia sp.]|nr:hypothetical protein [Akkermansia sp.]
MSTPQAALDALTQPHELTLGQAALLEKIGSPLILPTEEEIGAFELIPSLYLLSLPAAEGIKHLKTLQADAFAWADTLTPLTYNQALTEAHEAIKAFYDLLPQPEADAKKASPVTVG